MKVKIPSVLCREMNSVGWHTLFMSVQLGELVTCQEHRDSHQPSLSLSWPAPHWDLWRSGECFQTEKFKSGDSQDKAVLEKGNRALTWSLPMATRQNLLPWPASGSSSGRETPGRRGPKIPARLAQKNGCFQKNGLQDISLPWFVIQNPSP